MSLYHYPKLYSALLSPEADMLRDIFVWIGRHLDAPLRSIMDPACGSGTWLVPFAIKGYFVGGNDIEKRMIEEAERQLLVFPHELTLGDMRELSFSRTFDVAINLDSSIGHLKNDEEIKEHLSSVQKSLRVGGLYFLGLFVLDGEERDDECELLYESETVTMSEGGHAKVTYKSLFRDPIARRERIHLEVVTSGMTGYPEFLQEEYDLFSFPMMRLLKVLEEVGDWEIVAVHSMEIIGNPLMTLEKNCGDIMLILRKLGHKE